MKREFRESFAVEHLEQRALFSVAPLVMGPMPMEENSLFTIVQTAAKKKKYPHPLQQPFNVAGDYTHDVHPGGNPDVSSPYTFTGTGNTPTLGVFNLTGYLQTPGFIANGTAHGKLWLSNAKGSLTLIVDGPPQSSGVLPPTLSFRILAGHGDYVHSRGNGQIVIAASDTTMKFVFKFNQAS